MTQEPTTRIGIDLGGTKIAGVRLRGDNEFSDIRQLSTPRENYHGTVKAIQELVEYFKTDMATQTHLSAPVSARVQALASVKAKIGIGMPGSLTRKSGLVQNANSTWLNGKPFARDLKEVLGQDIRFANDANCFALSEAHDGAGEGARSLFGIILGTGCGGGLVIDGKIIEGPNRIGGEWGHNPLPWATADETPGTTCWCGRNGCMETWVSGPGLSADHQRHGGENLTAEEIAARAKVGDKAATATLNRHASRLARGITMVINIFDPERIVLGGGLSSMSHLYRDLPGLISPHIFADEKTVDLRAPKHGPASGVRGAARLWG